MTTAETTVSFDVLNAYTSVSAAVFKVGLTTDTPADDDGAFGLTVNGAEVTATNSFETTFIYPEKP